MSHLARTKNLVTRAVNKAWRLSGAVLKNNTIIARRFATRLRSQWCGESDRREVRKTFQRALEENANLFLVSDEVLDFLPTERPTLSIILTLCGEASADVAALRGLADLQQDFANEGNAEVFLVGPLSSIPPGRVRGATVVNAKPGVYLRVAHQAKSLCLLFLGHGVRLGGLSGDQGRSTSQVGVGVRAAMSKLHDSVSVYTVIGPIVRTDERLFSAGFVLALEGSKMVPYGAGLPVGSPETMFARDVDGGSADALFVSREKFITLGGFQSSDDPASTSVACGAEWCRRVIQDGGRIYYEPLFLAQQTITGKASGETSDIDDANCLRSRDRRRTPSRVLWIEERVPYPWLGAGHPRSAELLASLVEMGCALTFYPTLQVLESWDEVRRLVDPRVEVMIGYDWLDFSRFWKSRKGFYDLCIISRPHNMQRLRRTLFSDPNHPPIVYDAEALYCMRGIIWRRLHGLPTSAAMERRRVVSEVQLAQGSAAVLSVSEQEADRFRAHLGNNKDTGHPPRVHVLRHTVPITPTPAGFSERNGMLFVGTLHDMGSPNADSVDWFLRKIFPCLRESARAAGEVPPVFRLAGTNLAGLDFSGQDGVEVLGRVDNLDPIYNQARVFIAPTRYAAGVPLKIYEAAGRGVPIVATPLIAEQLGWLDGQELLVAASVVNFASACRRLHGNPELWEHLRTNALHRVTAECSRAEFRSTVARVVAENV